MRSLHYSDISTLSRCLRLCLEIRHLRDCLVIEAELLNVPRVSGDKTKYADMQKDIFMSFCISVYASLDMTSQL